MAKTPFATINRRMKAIWITAGHHSDLGHGNNAVRDNQQENESDLDNGRIHGSSPAQVVSKQPCRAAHSIPGSAQVRIDAIGCDDGARSSTSGEEMLPMFLTTR
jgi:hypothetical protein